jgi:hypothetical protein
MRTNHRAVLLVCLGLALGFAGGLRTASAGKGVDPFQTSVNGGLVNAADNVLQNLLGSAVISIRQETFNPPPVPDFPPGPCVVLDLADDPMVPVLVNVFTRNAPTGNGFPPGPCRTWFQVRLDGSGGIQVSRDPRSFPPGPCDGGPDFPPGPCRVVDGDLTTFPPGPCRSTPVILPGPG